MNFTKFLRTTFLQNIYGRLFLDYVNIMQTNSNSAWYKKKKKKFKNIAHSAKSPEKCQHFYLQKMIILLIFVEKSLSFYQINGKKKLC